MNFKKLLSIVLALTIVLSFAMTGFAADTKLYLEYDFAKHVANPAGDTATSVDVTNIRNAFGSDPNLANDMGNLAAKSFTLPELRALLARTNVARANYYGYGNSGKIDIIKNANGDWMFLVMKEGTTKGASTAEMYFFIPAEMWEMVDGETCIISYDTMVIPYAAIEEYTAAPIANVSRVNGVWWQNADGTKTFDDDHMGLKAVSDGNGGFTHKLIYAAGKNNSKDVEITPNVPHRTAFGFKKHTDNGGTGGASRTFAARIFALDGAHQWTVDNKNDGNGKHAASTTLSDVDRIGAFKISAFGGEGVGVGKAYSNIKMYSVKNDSFKLSIVGATTNVPLNTEKVTVKFGNPVAEATFATSKIVVKKNGTALDAAAYTVGNLVQYQGAVGEELYSTVDITLNTELEMNATYTVEATNTIANEIGTTLGANNVATFSTPKPSIVLSNYKVNGSASGTFTVDNTKLQSASLNVENTTGAAKTVSVIYAVYTSAGQLKDVIFANDTVAANTTAEVGAGAVLSETGKVKAFVWDSISSLKPWGGMYETEIAAAQ